MAVPMSTATFLIFSSSQCFDSEKLSRFVSIEAVFVVVVVVVVVWIAIDTGPLHTSTEVHPKLHLPGTHFHLPHIFGRV